MSTPADLQTAIAAYMSKYPNVPLSVTDVAAATSVTAGQAAAMLSRIVAEARPYPIVRSGRGQYKWLHDPADHYACVQVLADTIRLIAGACPSAELAGMVLRLARTQLNPQTGQSELIHYRWPIVCGEQGGNLTWSGRIDKVTCPACRAGLAPGTEVRHDAR